MISKTKIGIIFFRVVIPVCIFSICVLTPLFSVGFEISPWLNIISLVFAIIVGFFIAAATTNYITYQSSLSQENATLMALYNAATIVAPTQKEKVVDAIDVYVAATLDYRLAEYVQKTYPEFQKIMNVVDQLEPEGDSTRQNVALDHMHAMKFDALKSRESISLVAMRVVHPLHWVILLLLALTCVFLMMGLRANIFSAMVAGVMSVCIYYIMYLLQQIDSNVFLEEQLAFQDPQKIFLAIGRQPYYPAYAIKAGLVKEFPAIYRIGGVARAGQRRKMTLVKPKKKQK